MKTQSTSTRKKYVYEWEVQGYYYGTWEVVTTTETRKEAIEHVKAYRDNERGTSFRIKRVKAEQ